MTVLSFTQAAQSIEADMEQTERRLYVLVEENSRLRGELLDSQLRSSLLLEAMKRTESWARQGQMDGLADYARDAIGMVTRGGK